MNFFFYLFLVIEGCVSLVYAGRMKLTMLCWVCLVGTVSSSVLDGLLGL